MNSLKLGIIVFLMGISSFAYSAPNKPNKPNNVIPNKPNVVPKPDNTPRPPNINNKSKPPKHSNKPVPLHPHVVVNPSGKHHVGHQLTTNPNFNNTHNGWNGHTYSGHTYKHFCFSNSWVGWNHKCWYKPWGMWVFWSANAGCWYWLYNNSIYLPVDDMENEELDDGD